MFPILLRIGPVTLHTYGLLVALGFLAAVFIARREFVREGWPISLVDEVVVYLMISGLFGARLFYFVLEGFQEFKMDPWVFLRIWEGGLVFYGGLIFGLVTLYLFAQFREINFLSLMDTLAAPLLLGHAIGRLGCFAAGCCYGKATDFILRIIFTHPESLAPRFVPLHPTQLYSSLGDLALFWGALKLRRQYPARGVVSAYYLFGYGLFRFLIEFLRGDDRGRFLASLSPSQWVGILLILSGITLFIYVKRRESSR
jgi:phosphatidylglycerol:prolipoprotein diacylglycerol transferase